MAPNLLVGHSFGSPTFDPVSHIFIDISATLFSPGLEMD